MICHKDYLSIKGALGSCPHLISFLGSRRKIQNFRENLYYGFPWDSRFGAYSMQTKKQTTTCKSAHVENLVGLARDEPVSYSAVQFIEKPDQALI